ncbi:hypothetical protein [Endozoicomonas sp. ONNA1]|nr:hypothetical protein [Endozoicomonas sp. ONNA1]
MLFKDLLLKTKGRTWQEIVAERPALCRVYFGMGACGVPGTAP